MTQLLMEKKKLDDEIKNGLLQDDENNIITRKKLEKNSIKITSREINKIIELLDILNIPYLFSKGEGEYLAVLLNKYNIIDMFLTDDTDPIPSGINYMIKFHFYLTENFKAMKQTPFYQ